jgi:hypothetical protein
MFVEFEESTGYKENTSDLSKPTLKNLSYLLRHQELWPKDFKWYYPNFDRCAMGLYCKYYNCSLGHLMWIDNLTSKDLFKLFTSYTKSRKIFGIRISYPTIFIRDISANDIADRIDYFLENRRV